MSLNENKSVQGFALTLAQCWAHSVPGKTSTSGHTHVPSPPSASSNTNQGTQVGSPREFRDCSVAMPSSKGQPRRCHGPGHRRETPSRKHQLTPTQLKAGAEQTPNCHKSTLSSVLLQSSKAYSLLHVTKATGVQGQPWPGIPMQKPTIPKPCRVSQEIGFYSSSATQGKTLTNLRGFKCFPGLKKSALTSKFCGMASQTPFQSTKQMERGFYWHLFFFLHSLLRGCEFAGAHQHLALHPCYRRNCCASPADHVPLLSKGSGSGRKYKTSRWEIVCRSWQGQNYICLRISQAETTQQLLGIGK